MSQLGPVMLDIASIKLDQTDKAVIANEQTGGLILFSRNYQSPQQLEDLIESIRSTKPQILIAVDQEGGRVQRFKEGFSRLPALAQIGAIYKNDIDQGLAFAAEMGELMAIEIQSVGCDISFAPVLDIGGDLSQVIGDRALGVAPEQIIPLATAYIDGMAAGGMAATGKHFPGHGSVAADSHVDIPVDDREFTTIEAFDLKPFAALAHKMKAVMPAHVVYPKIDPLAAGFSSHWLKKVLRKQLGFGGMIFSDDLSMKGAETAGSFCDRAEQALKAGCDMVLVCNNREATEEVLEHLKGREFPTESELRLKSMRLASAGASQPLGLKSLQQTDRWQFLAERLVKFSE